jgi:hypothetical protein
MEKMKFIHAILMKNNKKIFKDIPKLSLNLFMGDYEAIILISL